MSEARYRICSNAEIPIRMRGELIWEEAFDLVCYWNDYHRVEDMAWLERCDDRRNGLEGG